MKRSTKILTTVVLTFGVAGGAIAYGKAKFSDPATRADYMVSYVSEELELDEAQDQALNFLKEQVLAARSEMKEQAPEMRDQVRELVAAESFDQAKALDILTSKTSAINANAPVVLQSLGNFLDSLNAEQKAEISEFMDHKKGGRFGHRGFGGHH